MTDIGLSEDAGNDWTDAELTASVDAYLQMLIAEQSGTPYSKAEVNRTLRAGSLSARTKGSVEYRMGNISAVLVDLGQQWVEGYKPAKNVGDRVRERILTILRERGIQAVPLQPTPPGHALDRMVSRIRHTGIPSKPAGAPEPKRVSVEQLVYLRDPAVAAWVLGQACGICEACSVPGPFSTSDGFPFLEVHHVRPLAAGGSDTVFNAAAVCPNCHRRFHLSSDRSEYTEQLYSQCSRLVRE